MSETPHRRHGERSLAGLIANVLLGVALLVTGVWLVVYELQHPPSHTQHVYLFVGLAVLGALLVRPDAIAGALRNLTSAVAQFVPGTAARRTRLASTDEHEGHR